MNRPQSHAMPSPFGEYYLARYPALETWGQAAALRAWNAADEYLLETLKPLVGPASSVLILNDQFGALTTALSEFAPVFVSDSQSAHLACRYNLKLNQHLASGPGAQSAVRSYDCLSIPAEQFDFIVLQIPKTHALLEDQLYRLRVNIRPGTQIIAAAMAKHIHRQTLQLFEQIIGPTHTSLAKKKARVIYCAPKPETWRGQSPYPSSYFLDETLLQGSGLKLINHANVFSRDGLDLGARLVLQHVEQLPLAERLIDLGCGNGILGLAAKQRNPQAKISFYDESFMAIASAKANYQALFTDQNAEFWVAHCLGERQAESCELVLNNPPFHQQHVLGDHIAWQMFVDARTALVRSGQLWVVGNRHLNYHLKLKKLFGRVELVAQNQKFVLLKATKR